MERREDECVQIELEGVAAERVDVGVGAVQRGVRPLRQRRGWIGAARVEMEEMQRYERAGRRVELEKTPRLVLVGLETADGHRAVQPPVLSKRQRPGLDAVRARVEGARSVQELSDHFGRVRHRIERDDTATQIRDERRVELAVRCEDETRRTRVGLTRVQCRRDDVTVRDRVDPEERHYWVG